MKNLNATLIKNEIFIPCFYYEIEQKCIDIITQYCQQSIENQKEFDDFSKNYHTFKPYFDFVICKLGYKVLNHDLKPNAILYGKDNHMCVACDTLPQTNGFCYDLSDDKTLNIHPMTLDPGDFKDCLIDWNGNYLLPEDMCGHVHILQQLLNLLLISNKEICEEYSTYESDTGFFVQRYLPLIRFQGEMQRKMVLTQIVIRKSNITIAQNNFIEYLLDNRYLFNSCIIDCGRYDNYEKARDISSDLKYIPFMKNNFKN